MSTSKVLVLVCWALALQFTSANAQRSSKSPYSIYGLGDEESSGLTFAAGMGDVKYGIASTSYLNAANPASYSYINQPVFDVGLKMTFLNLQTVSQDQNTSSSYLKNVNFLFPIAKRWKLSAGLMPFTRVGYDAIEEVNNSELGAITYEYKGTGGLNKVYMGTSYTLLKDSLNHLSVGVNGTYYFGKIATQRNIVVSGTNVYSTKLLKELFMNGLGADFGLSYSRKLAGDKHISIGASYRLSSNLTTERTTHNYYFTRSAAGVESFVADINYVGDTVKTTLPQQLGAGISFRISKKLLIAADFEQTSWSSTTIDGVNLSLNDRTQFALGTQLIPDKDAVSQLTKIIRYRAGARYANTRLVVNDQAINEFGITFGMGIPIIKSQSNSMFNIGIEYGQRGTTANSLMKEQFTNIFIGFSLTPHKFDRWFVKRRID